MLEISKEFVECWAAKYDAGARHVVAVERKIRSWFAGRRQLGSLSREQFLRIAMWKAPRQKHNYGANDEMAVRNRTAQAFTAREDGKQIDALCRLTGVGVPVVSTILHFRFPDEHVIFDVRCRRTLKKAGRWRRSETAANKAAYIEYVRQMRSLAKDIGVSLRHLDKALFAYDKYGKEVPCCE